MLKRDEINDAASCLNRADDDEPVFVLRAQDLVAPIAIEHWIVAARALGASPEKIQGARRLQMRMAEWRRTHGGRMKVPD